MEQETDKLEQELRQEVAVYVAPIRSFLVVDDVTMQKAGDTIKEINKRMKVVDEKFGPSLLAVDEAKRKAAAAKAILVDLIEEIKAPLVQVKDYLVKQGKDYNTLVIKRQEEERRRLAEIARKEEEDRRIAEAEALEKAGEHEEAQAVIEEPVYVPPPVVPKPEFKVDQRSFQKRWRGRGVNLAQTIKHIANHPEYQHLLMYNDVALNNMARSIRGQSPVPGIEFVEE